MIARNKQVLRWNRRSSWEPVLRRILANKINATVIEEIRRNHPQYLADDDFQWLDVTVAKVTNQPLERIPAVLQAGLSNCYGSVVGFHGTRSDSADDFLNHGIKLSDGQFLEQQAIKLFGKTGAVQTAILELRQSGYIWHSHGKIFLCLTKKACQNDHPHYMLQGSEYLATIAHRVRSNSEYDPSGRPLIIECLVPIGSLESEAEFWRGRSNAMLEDYLGRLLHPSETRPVKPSCAIAIHPIPPEAILYVHEFCKIKRKFHWNDFNTDKRREAEETALRSFKIWSGKTNSTPY